MSAPDLVSRTFAAMTAAKLNQSHVIPPQPHCLTMSVSREQLSRAITIFRTTIELCAQRAFAVTVRARDRFDRHLGSMTIVRVDDEDVSIALSEELNQDPSIPKRPPGIPADAIWSNTRGFNMRPTGRLSMDVVVLDGRKQRRQWGESDTARWRLEDRIEKFVDALARVPETRRRVLAMKESWERERAEEQYRREAPERAARAAEQLGQDLARRAREWRDATAIREFIVAARGRGVSEEWISWASERADKLDAGAFSGLPKS